jgi:hypothetical protein
MSLILDSILSDEQKSKIEDEFNKLSGEDKISALNYLSTMDIMAYSIIAGVVWRAYIQLQLEKLESSS